MIVKQPILLLFCPSFKSADIYYYKNTEYFYTENSKMLLGQFQNVTGEKIVFSINGAVTTECLHAKESVWIPYPDPIKTEKETENAL